MGKAQAKCFESLSQAKGFRFELSDKVFAFEKTWWAALRLAHPTSLFMVQGVPTGHEMLW